MSVLAFAAMYRDSEPNYVLLYVLLGIVVLVVQWLIAKEFRDIAEDKGYSDKKCFWYCFLFGIPGYLMVIALPNLNEHSVTEVPGSEKSLQAKEGSVPAGSWRCPDCGRVNSSFVATCACGARKKEENKPTATWRCPGCGRENMEYVTTCTCGRSKFDK